MIVLFLKDGFGNQLFEYAFAKKLSEMYDDNIILNRIYFRRKKDRTCQLERLVLNKNVSYSAGGASFLFLLLLEFRLLISLGPKFYLIHKDREAFNRRFGGPITIFSRCQKHGVYLSVSPYQYFDSFLSHPKRIKLVFGNFEHASFVQECSDSLKNDLRMKKSVDISRHLDVSKCNIAVHIRRGDYLNPQWKSLRICDGSYFQEAIDRLSEKYPDAVFNIFSNTPSDLKWIKENYRLNGNIKYIDTGLDDVSDFFIMSGCKHFIISNSTYSWWATYLSQEKDKDVIVPETWSIGSPQSDGIYLTEFTRLSDWKKL